MGILVRDIAGSAAAARSGPAAIPAGDTLIIWSRTPPAVDATPMDRLSLRCAFGGRFAQRLGDRRLVVDDDAYLVVNAGESCAADRVEGSAAHLLTVCFSEPTLERCLTGSGLATSRQGLFTAHLRPSDRRVTPLVRALIRAADGDGTTTSADDWEARAEMLLRALLAERDQEHERVASLTHARVRTRQEIHERISRATDHLLSHFDEPVNLAQLADVAGLAKFHFLRMFVAVHRVTPMEYLRCKRVAVASRLLQTDGVSLGAVARQVGVADRSTLLRLFIDYRGTTPDQYRRALRASGPPPGEESLLGDLVATRAAAKATSTRSTPAAAAHDPGIAHAGD